MQLAPKLEDYRLRSGRYGSPRGALYGAFEMPGPCGERLMVIASDGNVPGELGGWEHVSVSTVRRVPNWREMSYVKSLFWAPEDCVVQFHPPESAYVNNHPHVLHLWRSTRAQFPMPPSILVGIKEVGELTSEAEALEMERRAFAAYPAEQIP